jgi:hypothetical protein
MGKQKKKSRHEAGDHKFKGGKKSNNNHLSRSNSLEQNQLPKLSIPRSQSMKNRLSPGDQLVQFSRRSPVKNKKSWNERRKEAMEKILSRHQVYYSHADDNMKLSPLPAWPLVNEKVLMDHKVRVEQKERYKRIEEIQKNKIKRARWQENYVRAGNIPAAARTSLSPIRVEKNRAYSYHNHEGYCAARKIQIFVRQKQSISRKIRSFYISKVQKYCSRRMAYKKWRRSDDFANRLTQMVKRLAADRARYEWTLCEYLGVNLAVRAIRRRLKAQRILWRWWKSTWPKRLLRLVFSRSRPASKIANIWKLVLRRRRWRTLSIELVKKEKAAVIIQGAHRTYYARQLFKSMITRLLRIKSASLIQRCTRRMFAYTEARKRREADRRRQEIWSSAVNAVNKRKASYQESNLSVEEGIIYLLMNGSCCSFLKRVKLGKAEEKRSHRAFAKSKGKQVSLVKSPSRSKETAPFHARKRKGTRMRDQGVDCRFLATDELIDGLESAIENETSANPDAALRYFLALTLYLTHEHEQAGKLLADARSYDRKLVQFNRFRDDFIIFALRKKRFDVDRVHLLHVAALMNWHIYKRFDMAERLLYMAVNESHTLYTRTVLAYPCKHGGDEANQLRAKNSLQYLRGEVGRESVIDKGLISSRLIFQVSRRKVSGKDLSIRVFIEGSNILIDSIENSKMKKNKKTNTSGKAPTARREKRYMCIITGREVRDLVEFQLSRPDLLRKSSSEKELAGLLVKLLVLLPRQEKIVRAGQKPELVLGFRMQKGIGEKYRFMTHETQAGIGLNVNVTLSADRNLWIQANVAYMPQNLRSYYGDGTASRSYGLYVKKETIEALFKYDLVQMRLFKTNSWQTRCLPLTAKLVSLLDLAERNDNVGKSVSAMAIQVASTTIVDGTPFEKLMPLKNTTDEDNEEGVHIRLQLTIDSLEENIVQANKNYVAQRLQMQYRGWKGREKWWLEKRHLVVQVIQRPYRRHLQRRCAAVITLQKHFRGILTRAYVQRKYLCVLSTELDFSKSSLSYRLAWVGYIERRARFFTAIAHRRRFEEIVQGRKFRRQKWVSSVVDYL